MSEIAHLTPIDRKLLRVIQRKGDVSQAALAEEIGSSPASCWRKIRALEDAGVLGPVVRLVNPDAIDRSMYVICQVRMKSQDAASRAAFETFVSLREEVMECFSTSGEWDYQLTVSTRNMQEFEDFLMRHLLSHEAVLTSSSHFAIRRVKYKTDLPV